MKKFIPYIAILGLALTVGGKTAQASLLGDVLFFSSDPANTTVLEDNSKFLIFDQDKNDAFSDGDVIVGLIRIDRRTAPSPSVTLTDPDQQLLALFSVTIADDTSTSAFIEHAATTVGTTSVAGAHPGVGAGEDLSVKGMLKTGGFTEASLTTDIGLTDTDWSKGVAALIENASAAENPVSKTGLSSGDGKDVVIDTIIGPVGDDGYSLDAVVGMVDTDDFFVIQPLFASSISTIRADSSGVGFASERAGLSVIYHNFGASVIFIEDVSIAKAGLGGTTTDHQLTINGDLKTTGNAGWDGQDATTFKTHPAPEPGSLAIWAGILVVGGIAGRRRRKRKLG